MLFQRWWWRSRPPYTYKIPDKVMEVPASALKQTLRLFEEYRSERVEAACFWYGERDAAGNSMVRAVVMPAQENNFANYEVNAEAIELMAAATRSRGWLNVCQIHTHPGTSVEHSGYDDENAISRKALSLVFPSHGRWHQQWPTGVGVHEFQEGRWHLLRDDDTRHRVKFVTQIQSELLDLRNQHE